MQELGKFDFKIKVKQKRFYPYVSMSDFEKFKVELPRKEDFLVL